MSPVPSFENSTLRGSAMRRCLPIALCLLVLSPLCWGSERDDFEQYASKALVELRGDLSTLVFHGQEYFTADELRAALAEDLDVVAATRPTGSLLKLVNAVERTLCAGYAQSGCLDVHVDFSLDDDTGSLVVNIEPGPRYLARDIRILDAPAEMEAPIKVWLTSEPKSISPRPRLRFRRDSQLLASHKSSQDRKSNLWQQSVESVAWKPGEPVRGSQGHLDRIRTGVADTLAVHGYPLATFEVRLDPAGPSHTDLVIDLFDTGPRATLSIIKIHGLEQHSYTEVFEHLGLASNEKYELATILDAYDRLNSTPQFWQHEIEVRFPSPNPQPLGLLTFDAPVRMEIDLTEFRHVAKLGEAPLEVHQALQRAGMWAQGFLEQNEWDLCVQLEMPVADVCRLKSEVLVRPNQGWIATSQLVLAEVPRVAVCQLTVLNTQYLSGATDLEGKTRWSVPYCFPVVPCVECVPAELAGEIYLSSLQFETTLERGNDARPPLRWNFDPRVALNEAHRQSARYRFEDGLLIISQLNGRIRIDPQTGRLIEYEGWLDDGTTYKLTTCQVKSRFEQHLATFEALPNQCVPGEELGSLIRWSLGVLDQLPGGRPWIDPALRDGIVQFTRSEDFEPWERNRGLGRRNSPSVAWDFQPGVQSPSEEQRSRSWYAAAARKADQLFERETWPWTVAREFGLYWSLDKPDHRQRYVLWWELFRAGQRDDSGPLYAWVLVSGMEGETAGVAEWGLRKLDDGSFEREVDMLTTPDTGMMKLLAKVVPVVQSLPEEDTRWLCELAGKEMAPTLEEIARLLRQLDASSDEALQASLRQLLEGEIRERVEADLRAAASAPVETK